MTSKFPHAEMISAGEVKYAIAQAPNATALENGRPHTFGDMIKQGMTGEQTVHGLEEVDYESPMYRGLMPKRDNYSIDMPAFRDGSTSASVADEGYGCLPLSPTPKKVAW